MLVFSPIRLRPVLHYMLQALGLALALCLPAHAGLFDDNEARKAILEMRDKFDQHQRQTTEDITQLKEQNATMHRSLLVLQNQIEELRAQQAQQNGQLEQTQKELQDLQRQLKTLQDALSAAQSAAAASAQAASTAAANTAVNTPSTAAATPAPARPAMLTVRLEGSSLQVTPAEKQAYDRAMAQFQAGDFAQAERAFTALKAAHPQSAYAPWTLYWLGNAQYAQKRYPEAIRHFRQLIAQHPEHGKSAEGALAIANSQLEMGNKADARKTLENITKAYPESEAAFIARDRLKTLR